MEAAKPARESERPRPEITDWILRIGVGVFFFAVGAEKFSSHGAGAMWVKIFDQIGWGQWFRYATGVVELLGAILMLVPHRLVTLAGAGLLICSMFGAILAHVFVLGDPFASIIPLVLIVVIAGAAAKLTKKREQEFKGLGLKDI